jgi:hypothetical protein
VVLTGSALALASYLGASSNDAGHDGRGARHAGLAAALTASYQAQVTSTMGAGTSGLGTGLESSATGATSATSATGGSGPIALAAYGTTDKHPRPPIRFPEHHLKRHQEHHLKRHPKHHEKHRAVKLHHARKHRARRHPGRRHLGRLHANPWQIAGSLMPAYHWTSWQFHYLNLLWMRESGWNRFAYNHSSGAYGIPQAVPGDKMAAAGPDWRTSARTQIIWGMGYIRSRYGDPWNAWQHELRYGWY